MNRMLGVLLALLASPAAVADLYRWYGPDGNVHYGDRPPSGAAAAEARRELLNSGSTVSSAITPEMIDAARERARQRSAALERARQAVIDAQLDYAAATNRREREAEPLPGERLGTASGFSRLAPAYFERLARLETEVARARARLDEALAARNALR